VNAYADTSFLLSFVGQDRNSLAAKQVLGATLTAPAIPLTFFGALEFNNAARSLVFQGKLDPTGLGRMQLRVVQCLEANILQRTPLPVYRHYEEGEMLSAALARRAFSEPPGAALMHRAPAGLIMRTPTLFCSNMPMSRDMYS